MDGHHHHAVGRAVVVVDVGQQGDFFEESGQAALLVFFLVPGQVGRKLVDVVDAVLRALVAGIGQRVEVARPVEQRMVQFRQLRFAVGGHRGKLLDHRGEFHQLRRRVPQGSELVRAPQHVEQGFPDAGGDLPGFGDRLLADGAPGRVDDAQQPRLVVRVADHVQVRGHVLDFLPVEEPVPAEDAVGDAGFGERALQRPGLRVHAVKHRKVGESAARRRFLEDLPRDPVGLVLLVAGHVPVELLPHRVSGPEGLSLPPLVVCDDRVRRAEDVLGGAVVLLQPDDFRAGERLLEAEDVFNRRAAELVDALVVVAHDAEVSALFGQQADEKGLRAAGVLVFVHEDIAEALAVVVQDIRIFLEQHDGVVNQVVEIHGVGLFQPGLIQAVQLPDFGGALVGAGVAEIFVRAGHAVFRARDFGQHGPVREHPVVDAELLLAVFHQAAGIVRVVDGEVAGEAEPVGVPPQHPRAGRVERGGPHLPAPRAEQGRKALPDLVRGLVGERDGQNLPRRARLHRKRGPGLRRDGRAARYGVEHAVGRQRARLFAEVGVAVAHDVRDAVHEDRGLSAPRPGQNQQRAVHGKDGLLLPVVHPGKFLFQHFSAQLQKPLPRPFRHLKSTAKFNLFNALHVPVRGSAVLL